MTQQIQFIYLTQEEYDNLTQKNPGRLYFTSDTYRIYRGGDLYASRTYDELQFNEIQATGIKVDGVDVSLEGHRHDVYDIDGIPSDLSELNNDCGFITKDDIPAIPENVSELENDSGYLTESDLNEVQFGEITADSIQVDGKDVSVDGHRHSMDEIDGFEQAKLTLRIWD